MCLILLLQFNCALQISHPLLDFSLLPILQLICSLRILSRGFGVWEMGVGLFRILILVRQGRVDIISWMGQETSKIRNFLYVTGEDVPSQQPAPAPANTQSKPVVIDYSTFLPKKYFKVDATDEEIERQMQHLKRKEDILKQFKYYEDFDRIDFKKMEDQVADFQVYTQEYIKYSIVGALLITRMMAVQYMADYLSTSAWKRLFWPFLLCCVPLYVHNTLTTPQYHIINHEYFRMMPDQLSLKVEFDLNFNLYKDVPDMKYHFKYPGVREFYKTRRRLFEQNLRSNKGQFTEYFEYLHGLKLDPYEEFIKKRENQRVGNWEILTEAEKEQIKKEIEMGVQK